METKQKLPVLFHDDNRQNLELISRKDILTHGLIAAKKCVVGNEKHFSCWITNYQATVVGPNKFWKETGLINLTYKNGKLWGTMDPIIIRMIIEAFHLEWINGWPLTLLKGNKTLWCLVLSGKITNPERLCKRYSKLYFKGVFSYKSLKAYYDNGLQRCGSLWDIYYHTTNPDLYIKLCNQAFKVDDYDKISLLRDILQYCKYENSKMNPLWSLHRLQYEHQRQIERDNLSKLEEYDGTLIAKTFSDSGFKPILSERDAFLESQIMSNCIHSCYWNSIKAGNYLVATGEFNNKRVDIGIQVDLSKLNDIVCPFYLDQVHTIYNGGVDEDCRSFVSRWIVKNKENLRSIIKEIRKDTSISEERELGILPF